MTETPFHQSATPQHDAPAAADPGDQAFDPAPEAGEQADPDVFLDDAPDDPADEDIEDLVAHRPDPPFRTPEP